MLVGRRQRNGAPLYLYQGSGAPGLRGLDPAHHGKQQMTFTSDHIRALALWAQKLDLPHQESALCLLRNKMDVEGADPGSDNHRNENLR